MINLARCQFPNPELLIGFNLYFGLLQDIRDDIAPAQGHNVDALEFGFVFFNESAHHFGRLLLAVAFVHLTYFVDQFLGNVNPVNVFVHIATHLGRF